MDEYQVRTWQGWHHHMALSLLAVWFLVGETQRGQSLTPALTLPQVRYGLSLLFWRCCARSAWITSVAESSDNYSAMRRPDSTIIVPVSIYHHASHDAPAEREA